MSTGTSPAGGLPIDQLIAKTSAPATPKAQTLQSQLGPDAFLKLLTTQLQNQDPLKPVDETTSIAQLAQFSATQSIDELKTAFGTFQSNFSTLQSAGLLGKTVTVNSTDANGNANTITGSVSSISIVNGAPEIGLTSNGKPVVDVKGQPILFPTTEIVGIQ